MNEIVKSDMEEMFHRDAGWENLRDATVVLTGPNGMLSSYIIYMLIYLNETYHFHIDLWVITTSAEKFAKKYREYQDRSYIHVLSDAMNQPIRFDGNVDYIIHTSSLASPEYYDVCPVDVLRPNILGTYYLLEFGVQKKVRSFLLFSSGDVYGNGITSETVTESDMGIVDPLDIHSCYSESKRMAETMCRAFWHQYHLPTKMARLFHSYAPTMEIDRDPRVFAAFMKNVIHGEDIIMKSDGSGKRAFCYVADVIAGIFTILFKGENGTAYNVCNTEAFVTMKEFAETLVSLRTDLNLSVRTAKRAEGEHYTENTSTSNVVPSNERLKSLGWAPQYSIKEGFRRVYEYQKTLHG